MANDLNQLSEQSRAFWNKLPRNRKIAIAVGGGVALVALFMFVGQRPTESYATLFSGLNQEDAGHVLENLKAQNVPYRIEGAGGQIEVPSAKVHELRLQLATAGLPRGGGVGFELFDKQNFGATSFVEQMNYHRALQGELQRTISSLDSIARARVHLAMKEHSLFKDEDEPPSASIVLALHPGRTLGPAQIRGIVHLVSSSVEGLRPENVTLVDESGATLWSGDAATQAVEVSHDLERRLGRRVSDMVERVVGAGRASVAITAELDTTRSERTEESYDKEKAALRSEQRSEDLLGSADSSVGGVAGARGNLPGAPAPNAASGSNAAHTRLNETKNWEVSKTVVRSTNPTARIKRLHVAVVVDEALDPKKTDGTTIPRTKDEMAELTALVREAAGIDTERGDKLEVRCVPFGDHHGAPIATGVLGGIVDWRNDPRLPMAAAIAAGVILFIGIGGTALLLRRSSKHKLRPIEATLMPKLPAKLDSVEAALQGHATPGQMAAQEQHGLPAPNPRDRAQEAVRRDAQRAARVISSWLAEASNTKSAATAKKEAS